MRVELPQVLSVLSHEIRGPISVIQGYARLMLAKRPPTDLEVPMLQGVLDASARLAGVAKQASDIVAWCNSSAPAWESTRAGGLADAIVARLPEGVRVRAAGDAADAALRVTRVDHLAGAIAAIVTSATRDLMGAPVELAIESDPRAPVVTFSIGPAESPSPAAPPAPSSGPATPLAFDRGGQGLDMVLASYVLETHEAEVTTTSQGHVTVRLPRE